MIVLHKVFRFCAAHRYHNPAFSEEENLAAFGEDVRIHGHNYTLTVSVTGEVDPATGFLVDLGHLKDLTAATAQLLSGFVARNIVGVMATGALENHDTILAQNHLSPNRPRIGPSVYFFNAMSILGFFKKNDRFL